MEGPSRGVAAVVIAGQTDAIENDVQPFIICHDLTEELVDLRLIHGIDFCGYRHSPTLSDLVGKSLDLFEIPAGNIQFCAVTGEGVGDCADV